MSATLDQVLTAAQRLAGGPCAWTLFTSEDKALLRHHDENCWGLPGGIIGAGETAEEAARRWASEQTPFAGGAFVDSIDHAGGRVFIAPLDIEPLERERAANREIFWANREFALSSSVLHPTSRAAIERVGDVILKTSTQGDFMSTRKEFIEVQSRATRVLEAFGDSTGAAPFVTGESLLDYRARLLAPHMKFSKRWKDVPIEGIRNEAVLEKIEAEVFADALAEATHPTQAPRGTLRAVTTADSAGRPITRYLGDANACWDQFNPPVRHIRKFLTPGRVA